MDNNLWQYVLMIDPFAKKSDIAELKELNEWDLLIVFKNGDKVIYDRFTNYFKTIFYDDVNDVTDEQERKEFADRLRQLLKRRHITQEQLAEYLHTKQSVVNRWINGLCLPNVLTVRKITKLLNCSMDDLFYRNY